MQMFKTLSGEHWPVRRIIVMLKPGKSGPFEIFVDEFDGKGRRVQVSREEYERVAAL
jgi:hypothetical protein